MTYSGVLQAVSTAVPAWVFVRAVFINGMAKNMLLMQARPVRVAVFVKKVVRHRR
jgi:hypothetical protein